VAKKSNFCYKQELFHQNMGKLQAWRENTVYQRTALRGNARTPAAVSVE
jgi:hypothetical protein